MGTLELTDLGKHCFFVECRRIDFMSFTCDSCNKVFCSEHRSCSEHSCAKGDRRNVAIDVCPICAKGVHRVPDEDANITWERHVNNECDPSNYDKATKKKQCGVTGCGEVLTFSNTIKCRDCMVDHCLNHRFGLDHKCPGPKRNHAPAVASSSKWGRSFLNIASCFKASAIAGAAELSKELGQKWRTTKDRWNHHSCVQSSTKS